MSRQADFHTITRGGEIDHQAWDDFLAWVESNGGGSGSGGGLPWWQFGQHTGVQTEPAQHSPSTPSNTSNGKSAMGNFASIAPLIGQLGGPVLASLFAPDGQELSSFEGHGAIDPVTMLSNVNTLLGRIGQGVSDRAASPVAVPSAYAQQPAVYSGGGLPMPIGLTAQDPALANSSLLNLQGLGQFQNLFQGLGNSSTSPSFPIHNQPTNPPGSDSGTINGVGPGEIPPINYQDPKGPLDGDSGLDPGAFDNFFQPGFDQRTDQNRQGTTDGSEPRQGNVAEGVTRRRQPASLVRGADLMDESSQPQDEMAKAEAAIKLLMQNLQ